MCCSPAFVADIVLDDGDKKGGGEENNGDAKVKENRTLCIFELETLTLTHYKVLCIQRSRIVLTSSLFFLGYPVAELLLRWEN